MLFRLAVLAVFALIAAGCASASQQSGASPADGIDDPATTIAIEAAEEEVADERPSITVPLTLYRLIDTDAAADDDGLGTSRTTEEVEEIATMVQEIWSQADIRLEPTLVRDIEVPSALLAPIVTDGEIDLFLSSLGNSVDIADPGAINGFFLSEAFGVNGFAPTGTRTFFIVDEPTVPDQRVTSHEIGHLFGLHHTRSDPSRLLFSGTDGETLTDEEQLVSRYSAQGILDGSR